MKTRVIQVDPQQPSASVLADAADVLSRRGLVAFATETVYGLGALATDPAAVDRIYHAKGRPPFNPLIVHVEEITQGAAVHCHLAKSRGSPRRHILAGSADAGAQPVKPDS